MSKQEQQSRTNSIRVCQICFWQKLGAVVLALFSGAVLTAIFMRQGGGSGSVILTDLQHYLFSLLVYLGIASACFSGTHIRAKLFSRNTGKQQGISVSDRIGHLLLLVSLGVIGYAAFPDTLLSWQNLETSPQQGGLPGYFLIKSLLLVFCLSLVVFAIRQLLKPWGQSGQPK